jgi:hypothetical protein
MIGINTIVRKSFTPQHRNTATPQHRNTTTPQHHNTGRATALNGRRGNGMATEEATRSAESSSRKKRNSLTLFGELIGPKALPLKFRGVHPSPFRCPDGFPFSGSPIPDFPIVRFSGSSRLIWK